MDRLQRRRQQHLLLRASRKESRRHHAGRAECHAGPAYGLSHRRAAPGFYQEVLNTDAGIYGGSNLGNMGGIQTEEVRHMGRDHSLPMILPPLSAVFMKFKP